MDPVRFRPGPGPDGPGRRQFGGIDTTPKLTRVNPISGRIAGGLSVTIIGRNFRNSGGGTPPAVTFGGIAATSVVVVDPQTITCVTPAVPTSIVDIVVTINGQVGTLFGAFTFIGAVIVSVTLASGPIVGGTEVLITGFNFQLGSSVFFGINPATNVSFIDSKNIKCVTPNHGNGFVDVTIVGP